MSDSPHPPSSELELDRFVGLVSAWNARTDLTAARGGRALEDVLLTDARVLAGHGLVGEGARIVDVGAGVGAPSIPLALLRPDLDLTLVEPRRKRVAFLRTAIGSLGLERRARVVEARVDPDSPDVPGMPFDLALSRATFPPERWLAVGARLAPCVLVLTAAAAPPPPPAGSSVQTRRDYRSAHTGAPRAVTLYVGPGPGPRPRDGVPG